MDMMHSSHSNKRQRIDSTPLSLSQLPANVLSNCFSFLGPSGHYYFLATVCKDFKVAVDELYGDDRNTSMDSILTSISTCRHVMHMSENLENVPLSQKIIDKFFENDRVDLYQGVLLREYPNPSLQAELTTMTCAIRHKSTEIMRSIITSEQIIHLLKSKEPPEGMGTETTSEDMETVVQAITAACDPDMIHQLVEKGVVFEVASVSHSLRRKDLETFKCLVDILEHEEMNKKQRVIILQALRHEMIVDAIKYLNQKGYFENEDVLTRTIISTIRTKKAAGIDIIKTLLKDRRDISDDFFKMIIALCISDECMDILSYIHNSIKRIDIDFWIQFAEMKSLRGMVAHLRAMQ